MSNFISKHFETKKKKMTYSGGKDERKKLEAVQTMNNSDFEKSVID